MKTTIAKVIGKPSDYWICPNCNCLNWYENEECNDNAGIGCDRTNPLDDYSLNIENYNEIVEETKEEMNQEVLDWIKEQVEFYMEELDYNKDECNNIELYA